MRALGQCQRLDGRQAKQWAVAVGRVGVCRVEGWRETGWRERSRCGGWSSSRCVPSRKHFQPAAAAATAVLGPAPEPSTHRCPQGAAPAAETELPAEGRKGQGQGGVAGLQTSLQLRRLARRATIHWCGCPKGCSMAAANPCAACTWQRPCSPHPVLAWRGSECRMLLVRSRNPCRCSCVRRGGRWQRCSSTALPTSSSSFRALSASRPNA